MNYDLISTEELMNNLWESYDVATSEKVEWDGSDPLADEMEF